MQETQVRSLGWEDPLEKEMATHRGTWWATVYEVAKRVGHDLATEQQEEYFTCLLPIYTVFTDKPKSARQK